MSTFVGTILVYLDVLLPSEHVVEDYFGVPRHADVLEMISS